MTKYFLPIACTGIVLSFLSAILFGITNAPVNIYTTGTCAGLMIVGIVFMGLSIFNIGNVN